jgi:hypothetical protein
MTDRGRRDAGGFAWLVFWLQIAAVLVWSGACRTWDASYRPDGALSVSVQPRYDASRWQCGTGSDGVLRVVPR